MNPKIQYFYPGEEIDTMSDFVHFYELEGDTSSFPTYCHIKFIFANDLWLNLSRSVFLGVFITKGDVGVGTIVGSAVFNVLVIIGICGIFAGQVHTLCTQWSYDYIVRCLLALLVLCVCLLSAAHLSELVASVSWCCLLHPVHCGAYPGEKSSSWKEHSHWALCLAGN